MPGAGTRVDGWPAAAAATVIAALVGILAARAPAAETAGPAAAESAPVPASVAPEEAPPASLPLPLRRVSLALAAGYTFLGRTSGPRYDDGPTLDLGIRFGRGESSRFWWELEASTSLFREDESSGVHWSVVASEGLNLMYGFGRASPYRGHVLAGVEANQEIILDGDTWIWTNYAGAAKVGAGMTFCSGRIDVRVTRGYMFLSGSLETKTTLSVGFRL